MYVALEHTTHPVTSAAFFGLECDAYAAQTDDLASRRAAWLDRRPAAELASYGVPVALAEPGSLRCWTVPG